MYAEMIAAPRWTTSSFADAPATSPAELSALGDHVNHCYGSRGRWFALRCVADAVHDFVSGHIVTTLLIAVAVVGTTVTLL